MAECQFRTDCELRLSKHQFALEGDPQRHHNSHTNPRRNWRSIHHLVRKFVLHVCVPIHRQRINDHRRCHYFVECYHAFWNFDSSELWLRILHHMQHWNIRCPFLDDIAIWANQGNVPDWLLHVLEGRIEFLKLPKHTNNFQHQRCPTR